MAEQRIKEKQTVRRESNGHRTVPQELSVWDEIAALGREMPDEEWAKIPNDASINLEHYLYGAPKVESD